MLFCFKVLLLGCWTKKAQIVFIYWKLCFNESCKAKKWLIGEWSLSMKAGYQDHFFPFQLKVAETWRRVKKNWIKMTENVEQSFLSRGNPKPTGRNILSSVRRAVWLKPSDINDKGSHCTAKSRAWILLVLFRAWILDCDRKIEHLKIVHFEIMWMLYCRWSRISGICSSGVAQAKDKNRVREAKLQSAIWIENVILRKQSSVEQNTNYGEGHTQMTLTPVSLTGVYAICSSSVNKQFPTELKGCNYFGEKILWYWAWKLSTFGGKDNRI